VIEENRAVQHCEHGTGAPVRAVPKLIRLRNILGSRIPRSGSARTTISVECHVREMWLQFRSFRSLWYVAFLQTRRALPITRARGFNMVMLK